MNERPSQRPKVKAAIAAKLRIKVPQTTAAKPATPARPPEPSGTPPVQSGMEPLSGRVLRQIRSGDIDEERLLPNQEKRRNDIAKKLERMRQGKGWYGFVQANAHTAETRKAPQRRNAELALVQEGMRWRKEIERYAPDDLEEFERLLKTALDTPEPGSRDEP